MGCANSKTGATAAATLEENAGGDAPPKVMVDGEGQDGVVAANGNAVAVSGTDVGEEAVEKEACNGDVMSEKAEEVTSGGEKASEQNGGEEESGKSIQDGGQEETNEGKEEENTADSENAESRETNEEEKAE